MIDICTVVFEDELDILKLQANSIAQYCRDLGSRNIYVVLNGPDTLAEQIDPAWWGTLSERVLIIPRTAFSAPWAEDGWVTQQLWKMLVAGMSYNQYTMVLDAKTVFVRELQLADLFNSQHQLTVGQQAVYQVFEPAREICNQLFSIDMQLQAGPGGVPFFFHNDTVRLMIAEVTKRSNTTFALWFQQQGRLTEFMLYSAFCQFQYGSLDSLYTKENTLGHIVNVCHSEADQFDSRLTLMQDKHTLTVSIHRRAWSQLLPEQKNNYRMLLIDRGMFGAFALQ
jgi:Family of unknown function (DUF6492)